MIIINTLEKLPLEISCVLNRDKDAYLKENEEEIRYLESENRFHLSFEKPIKDKLKKNIADILEQQYESVKCYHCTKVISKEVLQEQGLFALNSDIYIKDVIETAPFFTKKQKSYVIDRYKEYEKEANAQARIGKINFTANYEHVISCYGEYSQYYGGEVLRRVLGDPKEGDTYHELLKGNGFPVVVECCIDFRDIDLFYGSPYEKLSDSILEAMTHKGPIYWDFTISSNLDPNKILAIHDYNIEESNKI